MTELEYLPEMFGPARDTVAMAQEDINSLEKRVPKTLVQFWRNYTLGVYGSGLLHLCNPIHFDPLLEILFANDSDFHPAATSLYAFTVFGTLYLWNSVHGAMTLYLLDGSLVASGYTCPEKRQTPNIDISSNIFSFSPKRADLEDDNGPLFSRAVEKLGEPNLDECYGFFPALALRGERRLENLKRVKALEHFVILAQLTPLVLKDLSKFPQNLRCRTQSNF